MFAGNTGFGYGDSEMVALSESLTAQFATEIAENGSIGQAWVDAKQRTLADVHMLDAYQEKVIQQFVFYGLPMFHVGKSNPPVTGSAPTPVSGPSCHQSSRRRIRCLKVGNVVVTPKFTVREERIRWSPRRLVLHGRRQDARSQRPTDPAAVHP